MLKKILYLLLAVSLGVNAGLLAVTLKHRGQPPPPQQQLPPGHPPDPQRLVEDHLSGMTRHLGLDPEQQAEIRAILARNAARLADLRLEAAEAQRLVADASAARAAVDSLSAVMLRAEAAVPTPEQRAIFAEVAPTIHADPQRPGQPRDQRHRPPPRR
jgi:hypothetical protein